MAESRGFETNNRLFSVIFSVFTRQNPQYSSLFSPKPSKCVKSGKFNENYRFILRSHTGKNTKSVFIKKNHQIRVYQEKPPNPCFSQEFSKVHFLSGPMAKRSQNDTFLSPPPPTRCQKPPSHTRCQKPPSHTRC